MPVSDWHDSNPHAATFQPVPFLSKVDFSSPAWLISRGGWENEAVIDWFVRYCRYVMERFGNEVRFVCTINEANIRLQMGGYYEAVCPSRAEQSAGGKRR